VNRYYVADVAGIVDRLSPLPDGVTARPIVAADVPALAALYLRAYDPPAVGTYDEAVAEMVSAFDGTWGVLWPEASLSAWIGDELVGVVQCVHRPSTEMGDAPDCPWIIEVFTDPGRRRSGLARALIVAVCHVMDTAGERLVGLTVDDGNVAALGLYMSLGFSEVA